MSEKILTILLIEDNISERKTFEECISTHNNLKLIGSTDSDIEGLQLIEKHSPDFVILDIELHNGSGNATSFELLEKIDTLPYSKRPKIIITTIVSSNTIYDYLHDKGVDLIFYKKQNNYSIEYVVNTILLLNNHTSETVSPSITTNSIDSTDIQKIVYDLINKELDLIGVGLHLQGRKYLFDAIDFIINVNNSYSDTITVTQHLVNKYKRSNSTISRAMQNAILHAWRKSSLEDLEKYYTAKINYETGVPTPTEFIYYYADKIKKIL